MTANQPDADLVSRILSAKWSDGTPVQVLTDEGARRLAADLAPYIAEQRADALEAAADACEQYLARATKHKGVYTRAGWVIGRLRDLARTGDLFGHDRAAQHRSKP